MGSLALAWMAWAALTSGLMTPELMAQSGSEPTGLTPPQIRDNILLIVADDVGLDRVESFGTSPTAGPTPTLDLLAKYGVKFSRAYANPVCSPTRATLLTGRHGFRTGIGTNVNFDNGQTYELPLSELTLAEALTPKYRTAALGKWHLGVTLGEGYQHPIASGFEVFSGSIEQLGGINSPASVYFGWEKNVASGAGALQFSSISYSTTEHVDDALEVIQGFGTDPWFMQLAFNAAHTPFHAPPEGLTTIKANSASYVAIKHRAMVEAMDSEIDRLLMNLDPDVLAHTWIIFVADNGTHGRAVSDVSLLNKSKGTIFEGGVKVPLIVMGPGIVGRGRSIDALVNTTDLFATILEMAGVVLPPEDRPEDSISLMPYLLDTAQAPLRAAAYSELFTPNGLGPPTTSIRAAIGPRYKLVELQSGTGLPLRAMFDLSLDSHETVNLLATGIPAALFEEYATLASVLASMSQSGSSPPYADPLLDARTDLESKQGLTPGF